MAIRYDLSNMLNTSLLDDSLWHTAAPRSRELTPLYAQRYSGPRNRAAMSVHPFWEMIYVFAGRGVFRADHDLPLREGTALLIPPETEHCEISTDRLDTLWLGLRGGRLPRSGSLLHLVHLDLHPLCETLWLAAHRRFAGSGPELDGLAAAALGRFNRLLRDQQHASETAGQVELAVDHLRRNYARPITVAALAAEVGCSEGHLHRQFRRVTGKTPIAYLTDLRLSAAADLLSHSTLSVKQAARLCGFADPLYFSRVCRKRMGKSPTQWLARR